MSEHIDPRLLEALKLDNESWTIGDKSIYVVTSSGALYTVAENGKVSGGSRDIKDGRLFGAVYRGGGPIRSNQVVVGLSMEIGLPKKRLITSVVESIYYLGKIKKTYNI